MIKMSHNKSICSFFSNSANTYAHNAAIISYEGSCDNYSTVSYTEVKEGCDKIVDHLKTIKSSLVIGKEEQSKRSKSQLGSRCSQSSGVTKLRTEIQPSVPLIVAVCCQSRSAAVVIMLAVMEQNCFLYLSTDYTKLEIENLTTAACVQIILVERNIADKIPTQSFYLHEQISVLDVEFVFYVRTGYEKVSVPPNTAYIIPTSGTTGIPKLVYVPHVCITPNVLDLCEIFSVRDTDRIFCAAPLTFDPSIIDTFVAFSRGASVITAPCHVIRQPTHLLHILLASKATILQATPTLMQLFGSENIKMQLLCRNSSLRILALGGEALPTLSVLQTMIGEGCRTEVYNLYGITEVSCWATIHKIEFLNSSGDNVNDDHFPASIKISHAPKFQENFQYDFSVEFSEIPIGKCLSETSVTISGEDFVELENNMIGEIFIGSGKRICHVVSIPSNIDVDNGMIRKGCQVFRATGDLGIKKNGNIFFLGRKDSLIKRFGYRVSLVEINNKCQCLNYVKCCLTVYINNKVTLFAVAEDATEIQLYNDLKSMLVFWKLPDNIILVPSFPMNRNGKVDLQQLLIENKRIPINSSTFCEQFPLQSHIKDIWQKIIGCTCDVTEEDNFIQMGGNSLSAVQLISQLEKSIGVEMPELLNVLLNNTFHDVYTAICNVHYGKETNFSQFGLLPRKKLKLTGQVFVSEMRNNCDIYPNKSITMSLDNDNNHSVISKRQYVHQQRGQMPASIISRRGSNTILNVNNSGCTTSSNTFLEEEWSYSLGKCIDSSPLLVVYENGTSQVFVGSHSHRFACLDADTGSVNWDIKLGDRIESSPCISNDGGKVYVGCYDHRLYCLAVATGDILWHFQTNDAVKSSPVICPDSNHIFFGSHDRNLYCVTESGSLCWAKELSQGSIFSSPLLTSSLVYAATLDGVVGCFNMNGDLQWKESIHKAIFSSLAECSTGIVFGSVCGNIICLSFAGSKLWTYQTGAPIFCSPFIFKLKSGLDIIAIGSHDNNVYFLNNKGCLECKYSCSSPVYATPFLYQLGNIDEDEYAAILCETKGKIHQLTFSSPDDNSVTQTKLITNKIVFSCQAELFASPVYHKGCLYVACRDNFIYCFKGDK